MTEYSLFTGHSFFSVLSFAMAVIEVLWLWYIRARLGGGPPHYLTSEPFWCALYENSALPGWTGIVLAIISLSYSRRRRVLNVVAVVIIVLEFLLLMPPINFASRRSPHDRSAPTARIVGGGATTRTADARPVGRSSVPLDQKARSDFELRGQCGSDVLFPGSIIGSVKVF